MKTLILNYGLTVKEAEAADLLAQGLSYTEASQRLGISTKGLGERMMYVYRKTNIRPQREQLKELYRCSI